MINCKKCGYSVPSNLKYAIMSNMCPSCGDVLFGDKDMSEISSISSNISRQEFSQGMNKVLVNDIALFIFRHYSYTSEDEAALGDKGGAVSDDHSVAESYGQTEGDSLEKIRDEVRREFESESNDLDDEALDVEDDDRKIARLKRLAKEASSASNRGVSVKRIT